MNRSQSRLLLCYLNNAGVSDTAAVKVNQGLTLLTAFCLLAACGPVEPLPTTNNESTNTAAVIVDPFSAEQLIAVVEQDVAKVKWPQHTIRTPVPADLESALARVSQASDELKDHGITLRYEVHVSQISPPGPSYLRFAYKLDLSKRPETVTLIENAAQAHSDEYEQFIAKRSGSSGKFYDYISGDSRDFDDFDAFYSQFVGPKLRQKNLSVRLTGLAEAGYSKYGIFWWSR